MRLSRRISWSVALLLVPVIASAQRPVQKAQLPAGFAGSASCADCHKEQAASFPATAMGRLFLKLPRDSAERLGCESCHGPGKQHAESGGEERGGMLVFAGRHPSPLPERNANCLSCHQKTARMLWQGSTHESRSMACTDCHAVMHAGSERSNLRKQTVIETCGRCHAQKKAQMTRSSHMPVGENKMECTSCHNPHGSANDKLLLASSVNATCYSCHSEKRGPFLWEHAPVVENCATCHDPHGSNKEKLLKVSRPRLCQQCHPTAHGGTLAKPGDAAAVRFVYNKQCSNCHVNIHGSNHPAGAFFTR